MTDDNQVAVPELLLSPLQMIQLSPIFIASFMVMTSMFNGDVKAILWLVFCIVGISFTFVVNKYILKDDTTCPSILPLFNRMNNFSISTAFIVFTLGYLVMPMIANKDYNYYVIVGKYIFRYIFTYHSIHQFMLHEGKFEKDVYLMSSEG